MPLILASLVFAVALAALPSTEPPSDEEARAYESYMVSLRGQGKRRRSSAQYTESDEGKSEHIHMKASKKILDTERNRGGQRAREKRVRRTTSVAFPISSDDNSSRSDKMDLIDSDDSRGRSLNRRPVRDRYQNEHTSPTSSPSPSSSRLPLRRTSSVPSDLGLA